MSIQYAALVAQVESANKVIKELTPLETGITDAEALEGWVRMKNGKVDMITDELKRLQDKLACESNPLHLLIFISLFRQVALELTWIRRQYRTLV